MAVRIERTPAGKGRDMRSKPPTAHLDRIDYQAGKSKTREGADSLAERTNQILSVLGNGQRARVDEIRNQHGSYGFRVNVVSKVGQK